MAAEAEAERVGGGVVLVLLLLLLCNSAGGETDSGGTAPSLLDLQEAQLSRLESLAESLSQSVSRLESALSERSRPPAVDGGTAIGDLRRRSLQTAARRARRTMAHWSRRADTSRWATPTAAPTSSRPPATSSSSSLFRLPRPRHRHACLRLQQAEREPPLHRHGDGSIVAHRLGSPPAQAAPPPATNGSPSPSAAPGRSSAAGTRKPTRSSAWGSTPPAGSSTSSPPTAAGGSGSSQRTDSLRDCRRFQPAAGLRQAAATVPDGDWSRVAGPADDDGEGDRLRGPQRDSRRQLRLRRVGEVQSLRLHRRGLLVQVVLLGDAASFKCRVRTTRKVEMEGPVAMQSIRGYLVAVNHEKVFVFNVSSHHYGRTGAPRPLFSASLQEIKSLFLRPRSGGTNDLPAAPQGKPLIAGDREKLLILGLGGGYVGSTGPISRYTSQRATRCCGAALFSSSSSFSSESGTSTGRNQGRPRHSSDVRLTPFPIRRRVGRSLPARPWRPWFQGAKRSEVQGAEDGTSRLPKRRDPMATNTQTIAEDHID
ncbi:unnamed protein product [Spirodela intermedia]|uniref:Uncharacterized protein n=1 Tax=Spirodela intermedia TaxID=51605 RepID=A0A7I8JI04_SPIIN|nr:unnamed protein product [Spirodela intermedia]CAA6669551.1 unnamed protein product [Spirodela intermedia]